MRWITLIEYATSSPFWVCYYKLNPNWEANWQAAWTAMLAVSPTFRANDNWIGIRAIDGSPTQKKYEVRRGVHRWKFKYAPITGFYPSAYDDGKISIVIPSGATYGSYKGPWKLFGNTAANATGATNWASGTEMLDYTITTINVWEEFTLDAASMLPTSITAWYLRKQHSNDNDGSYPTAVDQMNDGPNQQEILAKPTTSYGT